MNPFNTFGLDVFTYLKHMDIQIKNYNWSQPTKMNSFGSGAILESDTRSTGVELKSAAKPSIVIGLITKHVDCRITFRV